MQKTYYYSESKSNLGHVAACRSIVNEVTLRRAWLVLGWGIPSQYATTQP